VTGIALFSSDITPKRLEMLLSMVIDTAGVGLLVNRTSPAIPEEIARTQQAVHAMKKPLHVLNATTAADIDAAFAALPGLNINALMVTANPLFVAERARVVALAARHRIPTIYPFRDFADAGGLMSYGDDLADAFRHTGNYAGRVLKGEKAGNLPVVQPSKFEFVVNQKTAKALGYAIPYKLLALADEVIE
jgi:putative ABC transport system substrate-binding protein